MFRRAIWFSFYLLILFGMDAKADTLAASQIRSVLDPAQIALLRDTSGRLTINDISSTSMANQFVTSPRSTSPGYTSDVVWLRIRLQRQVNAPSLWQLELSNTNINDVQFFSLERGQHNAIQAGDRFAFADRSNTFHHPVFDVHLPDTDVRVFYLRLQSDSSLTTQLVLWQPAALAVANQQELLLLGGVLGVLLMSCMISLLHWTDNRSPTLLHFSGLTAVMVMFIPAQLGLFALFVLPKQPLLADMLVPWTLGVTIAFVLTMFIRPLGMDHDYSKLARLLRVCVFLSLVLPLTREFGLYSLVGGPMLQVLFMGGLAITAYVSWRRWKAGIEGTGYFLLAHAFLMLSLGTGRLTVLGLLPASSWTNISWVPAMATFLILVHMGITADVRQGLRERQAAADDARMARETASQELLLREEQTVFFSYVAHELRTPLGIIVTGIANLRNQFADNPVFARIERLERAAARMKSTVERHLTLQRLTRSDFEPAFSAQPPQVPALAALTSARDAYPTRRFDLLDDANLPTTAMMDQELIALALGNLLNNAAKYSPPKAPIRLEIFADTQLHYCVIDAGPGIADEECERMFQVFRRTTLQGGQDGFGIGLATAMRIAQRHDGSLEYVRRDDNFTVFTLSLPLNPVNVTA